MATLRHRLYDVNVKRDEIICKFCNFASKIEKHEILQKKIIRDFFVEFRECKSNLF